MIPQKWHSTRTGKIMICNGVSKRSAGEAKDWRDGSGCSFLFRTDDVLESLQELEGRGAFHDSEFLEDLVSTRGLYLDWPCSYNYAASTNLSCLFWNAVTRYDLLMVQFRVYYSECVLQQTEKNEGHDRSSLRL